DRDVVGEGGGRCVGKVHVDRVGARPAIHAQTKQPVRGARLEVIIVDETARPSEIDVDIVLSGPALDVDIQQPSELDGVALVDGGERDDVVAAAGVNVEVGGAA